MANSRFRSVLFWSIIAAAFIGPGTVTTAAKAGSGFGLGLLWALVFSIIATLVLQEAAARLTLVTGKNLGEIIGRQNTGSGRSLAIVLFGAIALGCGAYQAGNLLGALAGLQLFGEVSRWWLLLLGTLATALLWTGNFKLITSTLAVVVACMGITFCWVALGAEVSIIDFSQGLIPQINDQSALLVIGLIGTTIVPYNLFLASGLSKGQSLSDMRWGLIIAILLGGFITLAIMLAGTQVEGEFSFAGLAAALDNRLGSLGAPFLATGLFAAGFSSAITAPLAAAVTGQSLFSSSSQDWLPQGKFFRLTWGIVLWSGLIFALTEVQPIPAIIAAQAINGVILPLVAVFLLIVINDQRLLSEAHTNPTWLNLLGFAIVGISVFLGVNNILLALGKISTALALEEGIRYGINGTLAVIIMLWTGWRAARIGKES